MRRAMIKGLLAHKLRLALTALSVVLGVSFVAGTFVLTDTLGATFDNLFNEVTARAGLGDNTKYLGWGVAFLDIDHDGWKDILIANGHVYPEVEGNSPKETYRQRKLVYWNQGGGAFRDISAQCGPAITELRPARGMAVADLDNDGRLEVVVSNMNDLPSLLKNFGETQNSILIELVGTQSNRSAIGAKVTLRSGRLSQTDEVRSGGSYISQNDLRLHFGLGDHRLADKVEISWPSGATEILEDLEADRFYCVKEGAGVVPCASIRPSATPTRK